MQPRRSIQVCCLFILVATLGVVHKPNLLSTYKDTNLVRNLNPNGWKLFSTESTPVAYETHDSISVKQTIDYLENVSRSFTHYKSHWDLKTHFTGTNTSVCMIQKNGHAAIQYVSCLLTYKEYEIDKQYRRLESMAIFAGAFDNLCQFTVIRKKPGSANFKRVVFIRDPLERFISGWLFLCKRNKICFHCGQDFACFIRTLYLCWKTGKQYDKICTYNTPSREAPNNRSAHIYNHMYPQVSYCRLETRRDEYEVIEYSTQNVNNFLLSAARPILSDEDYENLKGRLQQKTNHAASENDAEELESLIRSNREFSSMFAQLFYMDYKIFDIKIPSFIVEHKLYEDAIEQR